MNVHDPDRLGRIRHLNDLLRCQGISGQVVIAAGLDALGKWALRHSCWSSFVTFGHTSLR